MLQPFFHVVVGVVFVLLDGIDGNVQAFGDFLVNSVLPSLQQFGQWVMDNIVPALSQLWGYLQENLLPVLSDFASWISGTVVPALSDMWTWISSNIIPILQGLWDILSATVFPVLQTLADIIFNTVIPALQDAYGWFSDNIIPIIKSVGDAISGAIRDFSNFANQVKRSVHEAQNRVESAIDKIVGFFGDLPGRIRGAFGDVGSLLTGAGQSIIRGLQAGIESQLGPLYSVVSSIAGRIQALKGPLPYDRKLLVPNGRAITDGLLAGIEGGMRGVLSYVSGIAGAIESAAGVASIPVSMSAAMGEVYGVGSSIKSPVTAGRITGISEGRPTVNQYITNRIVRTNDDLYSAAEIINRSALSNAMGVMRCPAS